VICDWHYTRRADYPSIPLFLEKGFRVFPGGWREVEAVKAFNRYARQYKSERMLGYLATTWGAVKPGSLATWPPILTAFQAI